MNRKGLLKTTSVIFFAYLFFLLLGCFLPSRESQTLPEDDAIGSTPIDLAADESEPEYYPRREPLSHVVLILLDGVRPDILRQADTPHLDRLAAEGVSTHNAWSPWPSNTIAGIPTVHTGAPPEVHDVSDWHGSIEAETLSEVFDEAGLVSALVGSDPILGGYVARHVTGYYYHQDEGHFTDQAIAWFRLYRPFFLFLYNSRPDSAGHAHGHTSQQYRQAIERADLEIGRLLAAIEDVGALDHTLLVVTTDHGMTGFAHGYGYETDRRVFSIWRGPGVAQGHVMANTVPVAEQLPGQVTVATHPLESSDWSEMDVNWANQPAMGEAYSQATVDSEGSVNWDVSGLVLASLEASDYLDIGLQASEPESDAAVFFNTREWSDSSTHPRLSLRYQVEGGASAQLEIPPSQDALLREGSPDENFGYHANFHIGRFQRHGEGRAVLRFDLSQVPAGAAVLEANLQAWCWRRYPLGFSARDVAHHLQDIAPTITHLAGLRAPRDSVGELIGEVLVEIHDQ